MKQLFSLSWILIFSLTLWAESTPTDASSRVTSIYVSQDFINSQLTAHMKSKLIKDIKIQLDPESQQLFMTGVINVPVEEMRVVNLDPSLGAFKFRVTLKPSTTKQGHLILDFPLDQTYFYPAVSQDPKHDRVIIPVQLLSLALASARGYLSALSGDFSSFDRQEEKLKALKKSLDRSVAMEKNADAKEDMIAERKKLTLQLQAMPVERKQLEAVAKQVEHVLGFTGEKEINLNDELGARKNGLILKIKLAQLTPYLKDVELGGIRIVHDKKDGNGENYLAVDVNSLLAAPVPPKSTSPPADRPPMKTPPSLIVRINQALFESETVLNSEKKATKSKLEDFLVSLKDDGLHVSGRWKSFFFSVPFDTNVDFVTTKPDVFEVRVRELRVAGIDLEFLSQFILEVIQKRLELALKGICKFDYVGEEKDHSRALQVTVQPQALVPAFPDLHLVAVDVRDGEFLMKVGQVQP